MEQLGMGAAIIKATTNEEISPLVGQILNEWQEKENRLLIGHVILDLMEGGKLSGKDLAYLFLFGVEVGLRMAGRE